MNNNCFCVITEIKTMRKVSRNLKHFKIQSLNNFLSTRVWHFLSGFCIKCCNYNRNHTFSSFDQTKSVLCLVYWSRKSVEFILKHRSNRMYKYFSNLDRKSDSEVIRWSCDLWVSLNFWNGRRMFAQSKLYFESLHHMWFRYALFLF